MITVKELHRRLEDLMAEDPAVGDLDFSTCGVTGTLRVLRERPHGKITGLSLEDDSYMAPFIEEAQEALRLSHRSALKQSDMEYLIELCAESGANGEDLDLAYLHEFIEGCDDPFAFLENASVIEYKGILFDEWTVDKENGGVYGEMCEHCAEKYKNILGKELSEGGMGACSVKGCDVVGMDADTATHYYVDFDIEQIRVVETKGQRKESTQAVYLQLGEDATWQAYIGTEPSAEGDGKLCAEGEYPISFFYNRYDIMGDRIVEKDVCNNREELLESLDWIGKCRGSIREIWGVESFDANVQNIFSAAASKRWEIAQESIEAFNTPDEKPSLGDLIHSAASRLEKAFARRSDKDQERGS